MKRSVLKSVICSLLIVVMLAASAPSYAASVARLMKVNGDYVRLRESAKEGSSVIQRLRKGTKLLYWGVKEDAMYKVMTSSGAVGYVYGGYMATYGAMNLDSVYVTTAPTAMYTRANGTLVSALQRLFYSTSFDKSLKVGASVVCARRSGCTATFDELNKFFTISNMPVATSQYWNNIYGATPGQAAADAEGRQVMRVLARNMVFLMRSIALGKREFGAPQPETQRMWTNFID